MSIKKRLSEYVDAELVVAFTRSGPGSAKGAKTTAALEARAALLREIREALKGAFLAGEKGSSDLPDEIADVFLCRNDAD